MDKFYKFLSKLFSGKIEDAYIKEQFPIYKLDIKNDRAKLEILAELFEAPAFKLYMRVIGNKKNFLGRKALMTKYKDEKEVAYKLSFIKGEAYNISNEINLMRYIHKIYIKKQKKDEKEEGR